MSEYLGSWKIDDVVTFSVNTHTASSGVATDADSAPTYRVYEDETATPILTGTMAKLDDANTTGFYSEAITLSAANSFEKGKSYNVRISATVDGVSAACIKTFQIEAEVDANVVSDKTGYGLADGAITAAKIATDAITADKIAADAIGASELAASAVTEIQSGLATSSALASVAGDVTAILADTNELQTDDIPGLLSALDGKVDTIDNNVDAILVDTGTTLPGTMATLATSSALATVDANVDSILSAVGALRIKKNAALANFEFVMTSTATHAPVTGLTVAGQVSLDGAAFTNLTNAVSEVGNGVYVVDLAAADLNADVLTLRFTATGADDLLISIVTQP